MFLKNCDRDLGNTASGGFSCSNVDKLNSRYARLSTTNDESCKLRVIHSNCQSAMNKRSEVNGLIDTHDPHILSLTEFGAASDISFLGL